MKKLISGFPVILLLVALLPSTAQARWLNPNTGRFQTMDTYEGNQAEPGSLHKYLYGHDNPINQIDPTGMLVKHAARDIDYEATYGLGTHQFLILIPDNPADFEGSSAGAAVLKELGYQMETIGGKKVIVVGGTPVWTSGPGSKEGVLTVAFFNLGDVSATRELIDPSYKPPGWTDYDAEGHDISAPQGKSDTQFILDILKALQSFTVNAKTSPIPYPRHLGFLGKGRNSNSFASSVLESVGANPHWGFDGWNLGSASRIPKAYFTPNGIQPGSTLPERNVSSPPSSSYHIPMFIFAP